MRAKWLCRAVVVVAGAMVSGTALSQTSEIVSFQRGGDLTWTNSNTNLFYQIEWAASLTASEAWHSSYTSLRDIRSSSSIVTSPVPLFYRVSGNSNQVVYPAPVEKTGQTNSYAAGDDGAFETGVAWPNPRFTVGTGVSSNCVADNLTGLMWLKSSMGRMGWAAAITNCAALDGSDGRGGYADWRLPNIKELQSVIDFGQGFPAASAALPPGHPFTGVEMEFVLSSTTDAGTTNQIWGLYTSSGELGRELRASANDTVWPVRGGDGGTNGGSNGFRDEATQLAEMTPLEFPFSNPTQATELGSFGCPDWNGPGKPHPGLDVNTYGNRGYDRVELASPAEGTVTRIEFQESEIHGVMPMIWIQLDDTLFCSISIECGTTNPVVVEQQTQSVYAVVGQPVALFDHIADLVIDPTNESGGGIHMDLQIGDNRMLCPYDYSSDAAKAIYDAITNYNLGEQCPTPCYTNEVPPPDG